MQMKSYSMWPLVHGIFLFPGLWKFLHTAAWLCTISLYMPEYYSGAVYIHLLINTGTAFHILATGNRCCDKHVYTACLSICFPGYFFFSGGVYRSRTAGITYFYLYFFEKWPVFHSRWIIFVLTVIPYKSSNFSAFSSTFVIFMKKNYSHPNRYKAMQL